jgi:hypothetical protein
MELPRIVLRALVVPLLLVPISLPIASTLDGAVSAQVSRSGEECPAPVSEAKTRFRGSPGRFVPPVVSIGDLLSEAISSLLDCREQRQAANSTEAAVREGEIGWTEAWQSETRANVTGSSTVMAVQGDCLTVMDVVMIEGEETRESKRMCRRPPGKFVRI